MAKKLMKYNPAFLSDEELLQTFVVRHAELDLAVNTIVENNTESNQHVLIIGPRGSGKTTLARRIALEVKRRKELEFLWHPLVFAEESYEVISAGEFWLEALFHVSEQTGETRWRRTFEELKRESNEKVLRERALSQLLDFADSRGRRLLLIVENLNMLLKQIGNDDAWALRHTLLNEPRIMLLATATPGFEEIENAGHAMFELFKIQELKPLDEGECSDMWKMVTGIDAPDNRIRPLQILTGGNPRLLAIISKFGAKLSLKELMADLIHLVDDHTDYFKSQLDNLADIERKAYLALAGIWDPATARDIAKEARLDVNKTSSLLNRLVKRGYVTVNETRGKTKWYEVKERLYNIYYLMRRRGAPENRIKAVVKFMIDFYGHDDLVKAVKSIAEEACGVSLEENRDHYLAYEEILKSTSNLEIRKKILASTPTDFFESSTAPYSIKHFKEVDTTLKGASDALKKGADLGEKGKHVKAIDYFELVLKEVSKLSKADEFQEIQISTLTAQALNFKGFSLSALGKLKEALQVFDEFIGLYKNNPDTWFAEGVAIAMLKKGENLDTLERIEEEILVYDELTKTYKDRLEPDIVQCIVKAMFNKGSSLNKLGKQNEAIKAYSELIQKYKDRSEPDIVKLVVNAMFYRVTLLSTQENLEDLMEAYSEIIETCRSWSDPEIVEKVAVAMIGKGLILGLKDKEEKMIELLQMALEHKYDLLFGWEALISIVLEKPEGQIKALELAKTCMDKNPNNSGIMNAIAWLLYEKGNKDFFVHTEKWARKSIELAPDHAAHHHTLACILAASNKGDEALIHAAEYLKDGDLIEKGVEGAVELFVELAAAGVAEEALELLTRSPSASSLEPLIVGLKLFTGQDVKAAAEIMEVANDIVEKIKGRQKERG